MNKIKSPLPTNTILKMRGEMLMRVASDILNNNLLDKIDVFLKGVEEMRGYTDKIKDFPEQLDSFLEGVQEMNHHAEKIYKLPQGDKGDSPTKEELIALIQPLIPEPIKGDTPVPGVDFPIPQDGKDADEIDIDVLTNSVMEMVKQSIHTPKDGEDAIIDEEKIARKVIDLILEEKLLKKEHINGLVSEIASYRNLAARPLAGKIYGKNTLVRGGGGSSSAGSFTILTATGAVDDSNKVFTFTSTPTLVAVNGTQYRNGHGVTIVVTTATLDNVVGTGGDIYGIA